ncbi:MAG: substrate-binding periplasmic protein [Halarcobacter sp.]
MKLLKLSTIFILLVVFANARSIEEIKDSGYIMIAVYKDFPPYSFEEKGKLKGIDVDLGKIIAKSLGVKAKWYLTGSDETLSDDLRNVIWKGNLVHKNKADMMFRIPYDYDYMRLTDKQTGELETEMVSIKGPYHSEKWVIATHKKIIPKITTLGIFAYQTVGVELDTLPDAHLSAFARGLINKNVKHYFHFEDAIKDFKNGKLDAIAGLKSQLEFYLDYKHNKDKIYISDSIPQVARNHWDLATAVEISYKPLSYYIDGVISQQYEKGNIKKIFEKYGVDYLPPISRTQ